MVRFDQGGWLLKTLSFKRSSEMLTYQLKNDDDVLGRIDAARELGKLASNEAVATLKDAVLKDKFWAVQSASARALGAAGTPAALDALLACVDVAHPRARRAVMAGLGNFRDDVTPGRGADAAEALERVLVEGDRSYYVEAEAAAALGKTRSSIAFAALERALAKKSHNDVIRARTFEGFAALKDPRGIPVAFEWTEYGRSYQARDAAAVCLGRLAEYTKEKEPIRDRLIELLDDPWLRTRMTAIGALRTLGDDAAIPALDRLAARELDGRVIRTCREATEALRKGRDKGEEVSKLRKEMDKLREENKSIKDRLEKVELKGKRKK